MRSEVQSLSILQSNILAVSVFDSRLYLLSLSVSLSSSLMDWEKTLPDSFDLLLIHATAVWIDPNASFPETSLPLSSSVTTYALVTHVLTLCLWSFSFLLYNHVSGKMTHIGLTVEVNTVIVSIKTVIKLILIVTTITFFYFYVRSYPKKMKRLKFRDAQNVGHHFLNKSGMM